MDVKISMSSLKVAKFDEYQLKSSTKWTYCGDLHVKDYYVLSGPSCNGTGTLLLRALHFLLLRALHFKGNTAEYILRGPAQNRHHVLRGPFNFGYYCMYYGVLH
jgi:hypothetical protein